MQQSAKQDCYVVFVRSIGDSMPHLQGRSVWACFNSSGNNYDSWLVCPLY